MKARLPQYGIVEEAFYQNHLGVMPDLLPYVQAALGAGQKAMREGSADVAPVDVDAGFALTQREDDALIESNRAVHVEQAELPQQIEGITLCRQMTAKGPAGGVTDLEFSDQVRITSRAPVEIAHRFGIVIELLLIESGGLFQHCGRIHCRTGLRIEAGEALAEGQMAG